MAAAILAIFHGAQDPCDDHAKTVSAPTFNATMPSLNNTQSASNNKAHLQKLNCLA